MFHFIQNIEGSILPVLYHWDSIGQTSALLPCTSHFHA
jgi:hypothetical protein